MVKISCIIPLFNDEKYISRCIESIFAQTYKDYEIIVVNDGSTDSSLEICNRLMKKNSNLKIFTKDNGGVCSSRNFGIKNVTGDYCLFIDSDDVFNNVNMFSELVNLINVYKYPELITFDYKRLYADGAEFDEFDNDGKIVLYSNITASKEYLKGNSNFSMVLWRRCYRSDILKQIEFENNMLPEDLATAFKIYSISNRIIHVSKSYYSYFIKNSGLTIQKKQNDFINLYLITSNLYKQQKEFFCEDKEMTSVIDSIYCNYLLTIYSKFYNSEDNKIRKEYLEIIKDTLKNVYNS